MQDILKKTHESMKYILETCKRELATIRAGRVTTSMLDSVRVMYHEQPVRLEEVAMVMVDERSLLVKPWERYILVDIEQAIKDANLNLTAFIEGYSVRVPVPSLTQERRQELVKQAKQRCEEERIALRAARRDANEVLHAAKKSGEISQDEEKRSLKRIQDLTDAQVRDINEMLGRKQHMPTQVRRALNTPDIELINTNTPQAKGRVERSHETLQDRLVKEMRLAGIRAPRQANAFLPGFITFYSRKFSVVPTSPPQDTTPACASHPARADADLVGT